MKEKENLLNQLYQKMIYYYAGDPKRIQHFIKVHSFARLIGMEEQIAEQELFTLETAAYVHDIGIKQGEITCGRTDGKIQEELGPVIAEKMLMELEYDRSVIDRVMYLVGHHHTYTDMQGMDYQILVEADFLVNLFEDNCGDKAMETAFTKIFVTETGRRICQEMFQLDTV